MISLAKKKYKLSNLFKNIAKKIKKAFNKTDDDNAKENEKGEKSNLELVKGSRKKKLIIRIICYALIVAAIITVLVINSKTPTGLVEKIQNEYAARGKGEFPVNVYAKNAIDFVSNGDVSLLYNDTYLEIYNDNGKLVNAFSHGMFSPALKVSEARFIIFDRDRYTVKVYNYSTELYNLEFEKNVIAADISRDGTFAVVTTSDSYNNTVFVYNKKNESVFTWNCADGYITDIAVANDGKSIAVSILDAKAGSFVSQIYILEFDSSTPFYKTEYNAAITSLNSVNENYFLATGVDFAATVDWQGGQNEIMINGVIRYFDISFDGFSAIICGREDNEQSNSIIIIGDEGNVSNEFEYNATLNDIYITDTSVTLLSGSIVKIYELDGSFSDEFLSETKPNFAVLTKDEYPIVLDNSQMKLLSSQN